MSDPLSPIDPPASSKWDELYTPEYLERRRQGAAKATAGFKGVDQTDPTGPAGHAYGIGISTLKLNR